mgnify:CR=1 FL=1
MDIKELSTAKYDRRQKKRINKRLLYTKMANQLSLHISRNSIDDKYIEATQIDVDFDIKPDDFSNCESDDEYDVSIVHNKNIIDNINPKNNVLFCKIVNII